MYAKSQLSWVYTARFLLHENLDDSCGNYRSDYLADAAVYTTRLSPDNIVN